MKSQNDFFAIPILPLISCQQFISSGSNLPDFSTVLLGLRYNLSISVLCLCWDIGTLQCRKNSHILAIIVSSRTVFSDEITKEL